MYFFSIQHSHRLLLLLLLLSFSSCSNIRLLSLCTPFSIFIFTFETSIPIVIVIVVAHSISPPMDVKWMYDKNRQSMERTLCVRILLHTYSIIIDVYYYFGHRNVPWYLYSNFEMKPLYSSVCACACVPTLKSHFIFNRREIWREISLFFGHADKDIDQIHLLSPAYTLNIVQTHAFEWIGTIFYVINWQTLQTESGNQENENRTIRTYTQISW